MKLKSEMENGASRDRMVSMSFRTSPKLRAALEAMAKESGSPVECWINGLICEALLARKQRVLQDLEGGAEA